jgi:hypothetical protein
VAHSKVHPRWKNEKNGRKFSVLSFRVKLWTWVFRYKTEMITRPWRLILGRKMCST